MISACCFASSLYFEPHALHILILAHPFAYAIKPTEQELKEPSEQAQVEDTNPDLEQGKPQCI
jgi:hypothetical protein